MGTRAYAGYADRTTLYTSTSDGEDFRFRRSLRNVHRNAYAPVVPFILSYTAPPRGGGAAPAGTAAVRGSA